MNYSIPQRITDEKDLDIYESFLKSDREAKARSEPPKGGTQKSARTEAEEARDDMRHEYLKRHIGKLVRAEIMTGEKCDTRTGILLDVTPSYIVIKPQAYCTAVIILSDIKIITVSHDNNRSRLRQ